MGMVIALAGDTMLGRGVAERLEAHPDRPICSPQVAALAGAADLFVLNLECCVSDRGSPWPAPGKPFFFRAPPSAADTLARLGVDAVTLANNHALDYGEQALLDTLRRLDEAGIAHAGAGATLAAAQRPAVLERGGERVALIGLADHPADFAASAHRPGIAYADLRAGVPDWTLRAIHTATADADLVLVSPHWGPNMAPEPVPHVRAAAPALAAAGAGLVAGHSAHVFHGVEALDDRLVLYDLGDFVDDYVVDTLRRNDLGLLWRVTVEAGRVVELAALPLLLGYAFTDVAEGADRRWIRRRLAEAVAPLAVTEDEGMLHVDIGASHPAGR